MSGLNLNNQHYEDPFDDNLGFPNELMSSVGLALDVYGLSSREPMPAGDWAKRARSVHDTIQAVTQEKEGWIDPVPEEILDELPEPKLEILSKVPARVNEIRDHVEKAAARQQERLIQGEKRQPSLGAAEIRLETVIAKLRAKGVAAKIVNREDGRPVIVIVKDDPLVVAQAERLAHKCELPPPPASLLVLEEAAELS